MDEDVVIDYDPAIHLRQMSIMDMGRRNVPVTVIGAGSLGSWFALGAAKLGLSSVHVYDFDDVEIHNVGNQVYSDTEVGKLKTEALARAVGQLTPQSITTHPQRFVTQAIRKGIVVLCVDSMNARRPFMERLRMGEDFQLIDLRMGGQSWRAYTVSNAEQLAFYVKDWYEDSEASPELCTAKGIVYNAVHCAMMGVNLTKRLIMQQECPKRIMYDSGGLWQEVTW